MVKIRHPKWKFMLAGAGDATGVMLSFVGASMLSGPLVLLLNQVFDQGT
jgi:hypothetical protein